MDVVCFITVIFYNLLFRDNFVFALVKYRELRVCVI